jgi:hypothetical protein
VHLAIASTVLSIHSLVEIGLGIPNNLTDELRKLCCVLCLLPSIALESLSDLGITLTVSLTAHCKVHTHLGALAHKVILQTLPKLLIRAFAITQLVLGNEIELATIFYYLYELICANFAQRTLLGCLSALVNVTTYGTTEFLCHSYFLFLGYYILCIFFCFQATVLFFPFAFANIIISRRIITKIAIIFFDATINFAYSTAEIDCKHLL